MISYLTKGLLVLIFFFCSFSYSAQVEDTTRVLFIGNSFTYYNAMPQIFEQLALQGNHPVKIMQHTPGGVSVGDISQGTMAHMNNPNVYQYLRSYKWDFLVLQDNQGRFVLDYGVFPATSLVIKGHKMIRDSLLHYSPCAQVLWFAGWGWKNGYQPYSSTGTGIIDRIYNNYTVLLDSAGHTIAPIGAAWKKLIASTSTLNLWDPDDAHPSYIGSLLTADVIYSSIFKTSALESTFASTVISAYNDSLLRTIAFQTVIDSALSTHLNLITPSITVNNGVCSVPVASSVKWYSGGLLQSTSNNYTVSKNSNIQAIVSTSQGCMLRSWQSTVLQPNTTAIENLTQETTEIYPNPFSNELNLKGVNRIVIYNTQGEIILTHTCSAENEQLLTDQLAEGCYFIAAINQSGKSLPMRLFIKQ